MIYVNFPNGYIGSASALQTMNLVNLEVDNIIPYNFSRYLVEKIDPNSVMVVPEWRASERPPLMAIVNAGITILLGTSEKEKWMETSNLPFSIFQIVGSYLNLLSMLLVGSLTLVFFGISSSFAAILLLGSTYFYFLNVIFTWPKFLMSSFIILGIYKASKFSSKTKKNYFLSGIFLGAALLSHEMALFTIIPFVIYLFFYSFFSSEKILEGLKFILTLFLGILITYLPWIYYKLFYLEKPIRGLAYHFFCYQNYNYDISIKDLFKEFYSNTSVHEYLSRVWSNFSYPFIIPSFNGLIETPATYFNHFQNFAFTNFICSCGLITILFFLVGYFKVICSNRYSETMPFLFAPFGTLVISALTAGCISSLVNHVWAYPAFLTFMIFCSNAFNKPNFLLTFFLIIHVSLNVFLAILYLFYQSGMNSYMHSSFEYRSIILFLISLFILSCLRGIFFNYKESR